VIQAGICALAASVLLNHLGRFEVHPPFLVSSYAQRNVGGQKSRDNSNIIAFEEFWTFILIAQNLIPIALYASVEFVKYFQAFFIAHDTEMYDPKTNTYCLARAWNLSDDIGQIEYLFSDKTGTLTENIMNFKACSIGGRVYGLKIATPMRRLTRIRKTFSNTKIDSAALNLKETNAPVCGLSVTGSAIWQEDDFEWEDCIELLNASLCYENPYASADNDFEGYSLVKDMTGDDYIQKQKIKDFFTHLCLSHSVFIDKQKSSEFILIYFFLFNLILYYVSFIFIFNYCFILFYFYLF